MIKKFFRDKGYISKSLFTELFTSGIHLVAKLRKNTKTKLLTPITDTCHIRKELLLKLFLINSNSCRIELSRYRDVVKYFNNIFLALIAYNFRDKKTSKNNSKNYPKTAIE